MRRIAEKAPLRFGGRPGFLGERPVLIGARRLVSVYGWAMIIPSRLPLFILLFYIAVSAPAHAFDLAGALIGPVTVCPDLGEDAPPDFRGAQCRELPTLWAVDPQGASLWVRGVLAPAEDRLPTEAPLGLFLSGKASSAVWFNDVYLGSNGTPSVSPAAEVAGRMDAVFYTPRALVRDTERDGPNVLVLKLSSHKGWMRLATPIHGARLGAYTNPTRLIFSVYWPSVLTFGVFIIGALYFGAMSLRERAAVARGAKAQKTLSHDDIAIERKGAAPWLVCVLSLMAAGQLMSEVSRGLFAYAYPFHDIRLLLILMFSTAFGITLAAYAIQRYAPKRPNALLALVTGATLLGVFLAKGFDSKSLLAVFIPTSGAVVMLASLVIRKRSSIPDGAGALAAAIALLPIMIIWRPFQFLDAFFFYTIAAVLLFLFVREVQLLAAAQAGRLKEAARAERLERALAAVERKNAPVLITLKDGSRTLRTPAAEIIACSAADDYVDVRLSGGRNVLHSGSLADLEAVFSDQLSDQFLRVHRSHLVNTDYIRRLKREKNGGGSLHVAEGDPLRVSRRIMPRVKAALTSNDQETAQ